MWNFLTRKAFAKAGLQRLACPALILGGAAYNHRQQQSTFPFLLSSCASSGPEKNLSDAELSSLISNKVADIREKYKHKHPGCLESKLLVWSVSGRPHTQSIELKLPSAGGDVVGVMAVWLQVLSQQGAVEFHSQADDGRGGKVISFVASGPDKSGQKSIEESGSISMTVRGHPAPPSLTLFKDGGFSNLDVLLILEGYERALATWKRPSLAPPPSSPGFAISPRHHQQEAGHRQQNELNSEAKEDPIEELKGLGIEVYQATDAEGKKRMTWDNLAGYREVKKEIQETILIPLQHPDVYDDVVKHTREHVERNRPKAILLEGPPGTGKTLTAKIIASESNKVMVHLPVESIASKWCGESEKKLSQIFDACDKLGGAIIFIDEIDSLVGSRDNQSMHEATRRILSVILQRVEGFQGRGNNVLIGATNRKEDLDAALISRFDTSIRYQLPDYDTRRDVLKRYAKHLSRMSLHELSTESEGFSNRDLKDICEQAERRWAAEIISKQKAKSLDKGLPALKDYLQSLQNKKRTLQLK